MIMSAYMSMISSSFSRDASFVSSKKRGTMMPFLKEKNLSRGGCAVRRNECFRNGISPHFPNDNNNFNFVFGVNAATRCFFDDDAKRETRTVKTRCARVVDSENVYGDERLKTPAMPLVEVVEESNDGKNTRILQCMLRARVTDKSGNVRCVVLPLDAPIDVLRGEANSEDEDLSDIDDKELNEILPDMQLALAKKGLLLQRSALCFTVRGPIRADYDDCLELDQGRDEAPQEATELVTFDSDATGCRYLVYAPLNPVLIVTKEIESNGSRHEAVMEEPDEIVEAAIERVYEELAAGPDDDLFLEMEKVEKDMNDSKGNNNKKGNNNDSGGGGGKRKKK